MPGATRAARCTQLIDQPNAWKKVEALRCQPLPIEAMLRSASVSKRGAGAMEVFGTVVYAFMHFDELLRGIEDSDERQQAANSWRGVAITPDSSSSTSRWLRWIRVSVVPSLRCEVGRRAGGRQTALPNNGSA